MVEYSFLSEFDLLRDARQDIRSRPWATHAGRLALDTYFKIQGAQHEIQRLNIEIKQLVTSMQDEELYLKHHVDRLATNDPLLSYQIHLYYLDRIRSNNLHRQRLLRLSKLQGFSGTLTPGARLHEGPGWSLSGNTALTAQSTVGATVGGDGDEIESDDDDETDGVAVAEAVIAVLAD